MTTSIQLMQNKFLEKFGVKAQIKDDNNNGKIEVSEVKIDKNEASDSFLDNYVDGGYFGSNDGVITLIEIDRAASMVLKGVAMGYTMEQYLVAKDYVQYEAEKVGKEVEEVLEKVDVAGLAELSGISDVLKVEQEVDSFIDAYKVVDGSVALEKENIDAWTPYQKGLLVGRLNNVLMAYEEYSYETDSLYAVANGTYLKKIEDVIPTEKIDLNLVEEDNEKDFIAPVVDPNVGAKKKVELEGDVDANATNSSLFVAPVVKESIGTNDINTVLGNVSTYTGLNLQSVPKVIATPEKSDVDAATDWLRNIHVLPPEGAWEKDKQMFKGALKYIGIDF